MGRGGLIRRHCWSMRRLCAECRSWMYRCRLWQKGSSGEEARKIVKVFQGLIRV